MKAKEEKIRVLFNDGYYKKPIGDIILHGIHQNRKVCGIYKIMFGDKYYIGQSFHIGKRMKAHRAEINKIFSSNAASGKKANILNHLKANPEIDSMEVFVLEQCNECDLQVSEQKWLSQSKKDKNCLNSNFTSYTIPSVAAAKKFKPVTVNVKFILNTQKELNLYNTFLSELKQITINPRANLKKWF